MVAVHERLPAPGLPDDRGGDHRSSERVEQRCLQQFTDFHDDNLFKIVFEVDVSETA